ncbi:MAG: type I restriction endonuclease, partial [Spirochaetes bacterium]|nr:type I restriction endonuclease [Spirochaetota bacterium]
MNNRITESEIENYAIELFEQQGFTYIHGPDIAPDSENPERQSFEEVILKDRLISAINRINPEIPPAARMDAVKQIERIGSPDLMSNNETFHRLLTEGINITHQKEGQTRGDYVQLIDFTNPENNEFLVVNQMTIIENHVNKRPDIILYVNGLPLVIIELKNAADENATVRSAFKQLQTYKQAIPSLFTFNSILIISDGLEAKAGTISSGLTRFMSWKTSDGQTEASPLIGQLETMIKGMLNKVTMLDLIRHFIIFEKSTTSSPLENQVALSSPLGDRGANRGANQGAITTVTTIKKLAAYHQYYAVNKAVLSTIRATGHINETSVTAMDK